MLGSNPRAFLVPAAVLVLVVIGGEAQPQNHAPNSHRTIEGVWGQLPAGRTWGATSAVYPALDGNVWVAERCGQNDCSDRPEVDPVLLFDRSGRLLRSFGAGMINWPHGIHVDRDGNVWVTDARGANGKGHQVLKFSPEGEVLMRLGTAGVSGEGPGLLNQPADVVTSPGGDIFVADGHGEGNSNRIVRFSADGAFVQAWGRTGYGPGEFREPHAIAMDSQGRLFVGDRYNNRIQLFDQEGNFIEEWSQVGRPSGIYIAGDDTIYVADSESSARVNPGWKRGIRIGSARNGFVAEFIPDPVPDQDAVVTSGAEGVAADDSGSVYGAEVGPRMLRKYVRR